LPYEIPIIPYYVVPTATPTTFDGYVDVDGYQDAGDIPQFGGGWSISDI